MDSPKNRNKRKFLACFRPITEECVPDSTLSPSLGDECGRRRKSKAHLKFSGAMKAVLFKVSLAEKLKSKKSRQNSSSHDSSSISEKSVNSTKRSSSFDKFLDISRTNSNLSSLFASNSSATHSSRPSSDSFHSRSGSERIISLSFNQTNTNNRKSSRIKRNGSKYTSKGMCIIVVCLVALVFWGKVFAIMTCTSTWLLFAPSRRPQTIDSSVDEVVDSGHCKKRVVMEGLMI